MISTELTAAAGVDLGAYCILMGSPQYEMSAHHHLIADRLEAVERGEVKRLMIFMPPRHGKSMLASRFFPAWYLGRHPDRYVIAASYSQELAEDFGREVRNTIADPIHRTVFPESALREDSSSSKRFHTTKNGVYFAVGVGGPITGRGAHLMLIDDPIKNREDADSEASRKTMRGWYSSTAYTRLMPEGAIVLIQTRWHDDDLAGWILREHKHEDWEILSLPAIAEKSDIVGREEGEALWPGTYPISVLNQIKLTSGSREWSALYQQRPMPVEGCIVKPSWFMRYNEKPANYKRIIQSWDTASKAGELNDYSVCTTWMETQTGWYLLDVFRKRMEYPELKRAALSLWQTWSPAAVIIEDKGSGQSLIQELRGCSQIPLIPAMPTKDKILRLSAVSPLIEAGRVFLPESSKWLIDFESEIASFPNAAHDDQVDSVSQALEYLKNSLAEFRIATAIPRTMKTIFKGY